MTAPIYSVEPNLTAEEFRQVLVDSTLAERRPANDPARLERMLRNANLIVTARIDGALVGVARSVTDFAYACYLSDLAVSQAAQGKGIGNELIQQTRKICGPEVSVILLSAPKAVAFYEKIGMPRHPAAFMYRSER
jgi:ribosomal protein S18 acetylase RimI-like enzyme